MTFLWPEALWLLLAVPILVAGYVLILRRKRKAALRYASLSMVQQAMGAGPQLRRHVPPLLFLLALIVMIAAVARPAAVVRLPSQHETIILSMDVSGSMRAKDVEPDRLTAAQTAAYDSGSLPCATASARPAISPRRTCSLTKWVITSRR